MPPPPLHIRCRNYYEDGSLANGGNGCLHPSCRFTHPDSPGWATAAPAKYTPVKYVPVKLLSRLSTPPPPPPRRLSPAASLSLSHSHSSLPGPSRSPAAERRSRPSFDAHAHRPSIDNTISPSHRMSIDASSARTRSNDSRRDSRDWERDRIRDPHSRDDKDWNRDRDRDRDRDGDRDRERERERDRDRERERERDRDRDRDNKDLINGRDHHNKPPLYPRPYRDEKPESSSRVASRDDNKVSFNHLPRSPRSPRSPNYHRARSPVLMPPPPLPPPVFASVSIPSTDDSMPQDERRKLWDSRVLLLVQIAASRREVANLEADLKTHAALQRSTFYANVSSASQTVDQAVNATHDALKKAKDRLEDLITRVTSSDFWPALRKMDDERYEAMHSDVKSLVGSLSARALHIEESLKDLSGARSSKSETAQPDERKTDANAANGNLAQTGSRKRPRLDSSLDQNDLPKASGSVEAALVSENNADLVDSEFLDRILGFEDRLLTIDNLITQQQAVFEDIMDERISAFIDELRDLKLDEKSEEAIKAENDTRTQLAEMQNQVTKLGETMNMSSLEFDDLADRVEKETKASNERRIIADTAMSQLESFKAQLETVNKQHQEEVKVLQDEISSQQQKIKALNEALLILGKHQPPVAPPPPPPPPLFDEFVESAKTELFRTISADITPLLEDFRSQVQEMLNTRETELRGKVLSELQKANVLPRQPSAAAPSHTHTNGKEIRKKSTDNSFGDIPGLLPNGAPTLS